MNIFVAKLGPYLTSDDLHEFFSAFGEVASAKVIIDRDTGRSKGFGFVEMDDDEQAQAAIDGLNGTTPEGNRDPLVVKEARPREERGGGGYGGGGRGGYGGGGRGGYGGGGRGGYGGGGRGGYGGGDRGGYGGGDRGGYGGGDRY